MSDSLLDVRCPRCSRFLGAFAAGTLGYVLCSKAGRESHETLFVRFAVSQDGITVTTAPKSQRA